MSEGIEHDVAYQSRIKSESDENRRNTPVLLSILIPTYNRAEFLRSNLTGMIRMIEALHIQEKVDIIISNNHSLDDTERVIIDTRGRTDITIHVFQQQANIGLEKNTLFCVSKSNGEYSMLLGDDDTISQLYLKKVIDYIENDKSITCIIPDRVGVDTQGNLVHGQIYKQSEDEYYRKEDARLESMFDAHQISGVVFKTEGSLKSYQKKNGNNIYPCVFFAGYNILRGAYVHITGMPVRVTRGNTADFSRRDDNLLTDIWQNINLITDDIKTKRHLEKSLTRKWKRMIYRTCGHPLRFDRYIMKSSEYSNTAKARLVWLSLIYGIRYRLVKLIKPMLRASNEKK